MSINQPINVLLVDDHSLIREGVRAMLSEIRGLTIVAEANSGTQAVSMCRTYKPNLVLMDLSLPELDGVDAIRQIHRRYPEIKIIALTAAALEKRAAQTIQAGASGYALKHSGKKQLIKSIETVLSNGTYIDPALDAAQVKALMDNESKEPSTLGLTLRERQVLKLISEGKRNSTIAEGLVISLKTVETHRLNLMQKLDAHNAAELTRWAYRLGMGTDDSGIKKEENK